MIRSWHSCRHRGGTWDTGGHPWLPLPRRHRRDRPPRIRPGRRVASARRRPGRYRIVVDGLAAASPAFRVATRHDLFGKLVDDTVRFFQVQRDGAQVPRRLDRRPSHLTDRHATVYATPVFEGDGGDVPAAPLRPVGGPVNVEG